MRDLEQLASERFVSLETVRRNGIAVATPVWIAREGEELIVSTPAGSGKVKRLRRDPSVTIRPCDRRGRVRGASAAVAGRATIVADPSQVQRLGAVLARKYRLGYPVVMLIERLIRRRAGGRVMLRIRLTSD